MHGGYGWGDLNVSPNDGFDTPVMVPDGASIDSDGWLVGGQIGAQYELNGFLIGIEGDVSWLDADGNTLFGHPEYVATEGADGTSWSDESTHAVADGPNQPHAVSTIDKTFTGYVVGGGLEFAISDNLSLSGEYLYFDFDRETFAHSVGA